MATISQDIGEAVVSWGGMTSEVAITNIEITQQAPEVVEVFDSCGAWSTNVTMEYSGSSWPRITVSGYAIDPIQAVEPRKKLDEFSMGELMAEVSRRIKAKENYRSLKR